MKAGTIFKVFKAHDGRNFTLRAPRWEDLDDFLESINSLVEEGAMIGVAKPLTREEETEWLGNHLIRIENGKRIAVAAEIDGKVVGQTMLDPREGHGSHVGVLGISIRDGYRDVGLGSEMIRETERLARMYGMTHISLQVYGKNERALHVYRKLGFAYVGKEPDAVNLNGEVMDNVYMYKKL